SAALRVDVPVAATLPAVRPRPMFFCFLSLFCSTAHRYLHSFPTRRSSDLLCCCYRAWLLVGTAATLRLQSCGCSISQVVFRQNRSEEHTSELQSRFDLVCRLLLEEKKREHHQRPGDPQRGRTASAPDHAMH